MKHFLFICSRNKLRSPTAENIFIQHENIAVRSAGLSPDADYIVSSEDLEWADYIFCMEKSHKDKLLQNYKKFIKNQKVIVLNIPDKYKYMGQKLIEELKRKVGQFI